MVGHQVPLEHHHLLADLKADDVIVIDQGTDQNCRSGFRLLGLRIRGQIGQSPKDGRDKLRDFAYRNATIADKAETMSVVSLIRTSLFTGMF